MHFKQSSCRDDVLRVASLPPRIHLDGTSAPSRNPKENRGGNIVVKRIQEIGHAAVFDLASQLNCVLEASISN